MTQGNEQQSHALVIERQPAKVLADAKNAAKMLHSIIAKKEDKVIINNKQYLELEDWELLGHFYDLSARVTSTEHFHIKSTSGWKAHAEVYHIASDSIISSAEAYCLRNEDNWKDKPEFQLASMAETRACSKAFRLCLSWVVVLAGYAPEAAEEAGAGAKSTPEVAARTGSLKNKATPTQLNQIINNAQTMGYKHDELIAIVKRKYKTVYLRDLTYDQAEELLEMIARGEGIEAPES